MSNRARSARSIWAASPTDIPPPASRRGSKLSMPAKAIEPFSEQKPRLSVPAKTQGKTQMKFLCAVSLVALLLPLASAQAAAPKTMVFKFYFDNTSPEATNDAEKARINRITDARSEE